MNDFKHLPEPEPAAIVTSKSQRSVVHKLVGRMHKPVKLISLAERKAHKGWSEYFGVLNFNELINEAEHIMSELDESGMESELLIRARHAMGEFYARLEGESKGFAKSIYSMKKNVEDVIARTKH